MTENSGSSETRAAWITAIATAAQTIAVILTLLVAGADYRSKMENDDRQLRNKATEYYYSQSNEVFDARKLVTDISVCRKRYDDYKSLSIADWDAASSIMKENDVSRMEFLLHKDVCEKVEDSDDYKYDTPKSSLPLIQLINRVFDCATQGGCDKSLTKKYFCPDIYSISDAFKSREYQLINIDSYNQICGEIVVIEDSSMTVAFLALLMVTTGWLFVGYRYWITRQNST